MLGKSQKVHEITSETLQRYVDTRAKDKFRGETISHRTIHKEIGTFASIWNKWAAPEHLVSGPAPTKGLVYKKTKGKSPFQTWEQIERQIARGQEDGLWDSFFLTLPEIDELLTHVSGSRFPFVYVQRLNDLVWVALGIAWMILITIVKSLNRHLLGGWLFARRTTVRFTKTRIVFYRLGLIPRCFQRDQVNTIQFKVDPHPRLRCGSDAGLPADIRNLYQDSGRLVMVYGARVEPIAVIVGADVAGQFSNCCTIAAKLSRELQLVPPCGNGTKPSKTRLE